MNRSAYVEARGQAPATALDLLGTQPEGLNNNRTEIAVRFNLADCMLSNDAGGVQAGRAILEKARELCAKVDDETIRFEVLEAIAFRHTILCENREALALNEELLGIAMRTRNRSLVGRARSGLGYSSMYEGNFIAAIKELDQADYELTAVAPEERARIVSWSGNRAHASFTLWALGYPERAAATIKENTARPLVK